MTILIADPSVAAIPVHENAEPLVDLSTLGIACAAAPAGADDGRLVRAGVARRLVAADAALPVGVRLLVMEGYRAPESQERLFRAATERLRTSRPELSPWEVRRLASTYVSPIEVAPHVAGAAVDVSLADSRGNRLPMAAPPGATPQESRDSRAFDATVITAEARVLRDLLAEVLTGAGLVNYPTEWWHWSFGDRYWALLTGSASASYGPVASEWAAERAA